MIAGNRRVPDPELESTVVDVHGDLGFTTRALRTLSCRCHQRPLCCLPLAYNGRALVSVAGMSRQGRGFPLTRRLISAFGRSLRHQLADSLRRRGVVRDRRARTHQVAIAMDIVDAPDRRPVFV